MYKRDFEETFLGETQDFYCVESTRRLSHAASYSLNPTSTGNFKNDKDH